MNKTWRQAFIDFLTAIRSPVMTFLEQQAVKFIAARLIKSPFMADFRLWAISLIVEELFEEVAKPLVDLAMRKLNYVKEVRDGEEIYRKIKNATDIDDWDSATDSV